MRFEDGAAIVRARSMNLCEVCGARGLQTHHRQARGMGGVSGVGKAVNKPSALIRVCLFCHNWIEHNRTAAEGLGLLVSRPTDPGATPAWLRTVFGTAWTLCTDEGDYVFDYARAAPALASRLPTA